jgi:anti-sigma regulatory factor (Ser/Thr protein kinase)
VAGDSPEELADTQAGTGRQPREASSGVAGHTRRRLLHSIRLRLLLPVAVATVGLVALGTVQAMSAARLANDARQAAAMTATATATLRLAHQLETEITEEDALRQRGGDAGASLVTAARGQTDLTVAAFRHAGQTARRSAPGLRRLLDAADIQVAMLPSVRQEADRLAADQLSAATYENLNRSLLAIADAVPELITDATLAADARAAAAIATAEHLAAGKRDLLRGVFRRGSYQSGELAALATLTGAENERLAQFNRYATEAQRAEYTSLISGDDVSSASSMAGAALTADRQGSAFKVDPDTWYIAQSNTLRRLHLLEVDLARELDHGARLAEASAQVQAYVTASATAGLVVLAFGTALLLAIRTARRLRRLRGAALVVAGVELPGTVASITGAADPQSVQATMRAATARADSLTVAGVDEISEVGAALAAVHRQALHLAAEQASLRLDVAALFVALSRRGQTLIQRQLRLLDEFERSETDPQILGRLFELDHLAARMRRNEENLLVLAGGEPGRRVLAPVLLRDLVQAAAAEIEDFDRVEAVGLTDVGVAAHAVRDVIHLLAELLENATVFSPPNSKVRVSARRAIDSVTVSVFDEGIGMPGHQVDELNARLAEPTMLTSELAGTMGLLVVGRLAARHSIQVELRSAASGGTVALVALPSNVLTPAPAVTSHTNALLYPELAALERAPAAQASVPAAASRYLDPASSQSGGFSSQSGGFSSQPGGFSSQPGAFSSEPGGFSSQSAGFSSPPSGFEAAPVGEDTVPLPRRRPGHVLLSEGGVSAAELGAFGAGARPPADRPGATPDPDAVRARLSGLARGLAAAERQVNDQQVVGTENTQDGKR